MARGELSREQLATISSRLPDTLTIRKRALRLAPDVISIVCARDSSFPIAAVCFQDATHTLSEVQYALHEYHAHGMYYRSASNESNLVNAIFFEKFYLDDAAMRLYNAGEALAEAIFFMLQLSEEDLKPFASKGTSRQARIGSYLLERHPEHEVSNHVKRLVDSRDWKRTHDYRTELVHQQPPLVQGPWISYYRKSRWERSQYGDGTVVLGGGDTVDLTTEAIHGFVMPATQDFILVLDGCLRWYEGAATEPRGGPWKLAIPSE